MTEWLVVRRSRPLRGIRQAQPELIGRSPVAKGLSESAPRVDVEHAGSRDDLGVRSEIDIATESMPMSLVEPVPVSTLAAEAALREAESDGMAWGVRRSGADPKSFDGAGVRVAIIDTGIKRLHPAFAHLPTHAIEEGDFTTVAGGVFGPGVADDASGHGTHCAGTICGGSVDGIRIGLAPNIAKLFVAKAIGGNRGSAALLDALNWAVTMKVDVVSMSLGFDFVAYRESLIAAKVHPTAATSMALIAFRDNIRVFDAWMQQLRARRRQGFDPVIVAASGNESNRPAFVVQKASPSEAEDVIAVGAVDRTSNVAPFSNVNPAFVGPGVEILSAGIKQNLTVLSGTSMACPHIAGLAALYWHAARSGGGLPATAERVEGMMARSAEDHYYEFAANKPADVGGGMPRAPGVKPTAKT